MKAFLQIVLIFMFLSGNYHVANADDAYDWGIGLFGGKFYDSSVFSFLSFKDSKFLDQYIIGITVDKNVWRMEAYPLSLQIEALAACQFGKKELFEFGVAPRFTWSGFPWNDYVYTRFRVAPVGLSITSSKSTLEEKKGADGENLLYYAFFELALSPPEAEENEFFIRLHHRCAFFDQLANNINGEDFLLFGLRRNF